MVSVVGIEIPNIVSGFLNVLFLAGAVFYAAVVTRSYLTDAPHRRPRITWRRPVESAGRLALWLGVQVLGLVVRLATPIFAMLSEASAELGEWFLSH